MSALQPWPVCPRPQPDESLASWFERIGAEYQMTPNALLSSFDLSDGHVSATARRLARDTAERLQAPHVRSKIAALSRLPVRDRVRPRKFAFQGLDERNSRIKLRIS
jgi:hypothetical protein